MDVKLNSETIREANDEEDSRQVSRSVSRAGSFGNSDERSGSSRSKGLLRLEAAKLLQEQVVRENEARLLQVQREVVLAKLECDCEDESDNEQKCKQFQGGLESPRRLTPQQPGEGSSCQPRLVENHSLADLPRVEIQHFDGSPSNYWNFMRQFDEYIATRVSDEGQKFLYLQHYCKGVAKQAIEGCVLLPREQAFKEARKILKDLFGQTHHLMRSLLQEVTEGGACSGRPEDLLQMAIRMRNCELSLTQMKHTSDLNATHTLESVVRRLPARLQHEWAREVDNMEQRSRVPTFSDLRNFIETQARIGNSRFGRLASEASRAAPSSRLKPSYNEKNIVLNTVATQSSLEEQFPKQTGKCFLCSGLHSLAECAKFVDMSVPERWELVRKGSLCFTCLNAQHFSKDCKYKRRCLTAGCQRWHHKLLHREENSNGRTGLTCTASVEQELNPMLGVVPVRIRHQGKTVDTYALLDDGSTITLADASLLRELSIDTVKSDAVIRTVSGTCTTGCGVAHLEVESLDGSERLTIEKAYSIPKLSIRCPNLDPDSLAGWSHLKDLDVKPRIDAQVRLLIGLDIPEAHWVVDQRVGGKRDPYAVKTLLGWVLRGPLHPKREDYMSFCIQEEELRISEQLKRLYEGDFFETEDLETTRSVDDGIAHSIVANGCEFTNGHFSIPLPWKIDPAALPNNRILAEKRLNHLKRRLLRDSELRKGYCSAVAELIQKGYASPVRTDEESCASFRWYLPHHAVFHARKPGKVRVVMDCAAEFGGTSLNKALYPGPDSATELVTVLLRFRKGLIAMTADIKEMFMQIQVPESDRNALRFLWWKNVEFMSDPVDHQMLVHPFGATSSPFCATYALRQSVERFGCGFDSRVKDAILTNFYVDDCLVSFDTVEEAIPFVSQIQDLLSLAGFNLTKWVSNDCRILEKILPEKLAQLSVASEFEGVMTLGLEWNVASDSFRFDPRVKDCKYTRRKLLAELTSIYDPLGLIAPVLLPGKIILQRLCALKFDWDDIVVGEHDLDLQRWIHNIEGLGKLHIPRCLRSNVDVATEGSQLHVFCDACERGYGAVAYLRFPNSWSLVCAKSRVAPIKFLSIPRLELVAAVLGVRLNQVITRALGFDRSKTTFWSDSMVVLHYIKNTSKKFSTFVANRVAVIHSASASSQWVYVDSATNPADLASRGIYSSIEWNKWLLGPVGLEPSTARTIDPEPEESELELKKSFAVGCHVVESNPTRSLLLYYSDWLKLLRAVAWFNRYKSWLAARFLPGRNNCYEAGHLTVIEVGMAELDVVRTIQRDAWGDCLTQRKIPRELQRLCPIIRNSLLCVGGRLDYGDFAAELKHPTILPKRHPIVDMLIRYYHESYGHVGSAHVLAIIRRKFWIVHGLQAVKRILRSCVTCRKLSASVCTQKMAPLHEGRVKVGWFPFQHVGVDYFGPFSVKRGRSTVKRYGCLFTCLQTRAVHLELASDLTTDSFIMALLRFISRRGSPDHIYSDNGTNFVGAIREFRSCLSKWAIDKIESKLSSQGIQWHFNPPDASHRGGIWERMIRSVRQVLLAIATEQVPTEEVLHTMFVRAEGIVNSRPIVPPSPDHRDGQVLTPNDLLMVKGELFDITECMAQRYRKQWKQVVHLTSVFWHRWLMRYLPTLQVRPKWTKTTEPLRDGEVVMINQTSVPCNKWPLGTVEAVELSKDGHSRTINIRTSSGLVRRDIRSICRLEGLAECGCTGSDDRMESREVAPGSIDKGELRASLRSREVSGVG